MTRVRLRRVFWVGAAAILVAAALVALVALLSGSFSDTDEQILWTLGVLFFTGSTTLAGVALLDRGVHRLLGWAIVVVAPVTFVLLVVWGWSRFDGGVTLVDLVGSASLLLAGGSWSPPADWCCGTRRCARSRSPPNASSGSRRV